jgi:3-oxoacyl-[acyl-carrier protein] reductase
MFDKLAGLNATAIRHPCAARSTSQAGLPYIPTDGTGRIVNVTSAAG